MLLKDLSKRELDAFMKLLIDFISADNKISKTEKSILEEFKNTIQYKVEEAEKFTYEEAVEIIAQSSLRNKKIVYFELLGVALVDGEYETSEVEFLENLSIRFEIDRSTKFAFANYYYDFDKLQTLPEDELELAEKNLIGD